MTMENFKMELVNTLQNKYGIEASVSCGIDTIQGVPMELLYIDFANDDRTCSTPLRSLYQLNLKGMNISHIAEVVADSISSVDTIDTSKIIYRLVNASENEELLKRIPHIPFYDMAIVFDCMMEDELKRGFLSFSNELMKKHNLTLSQLTDLAQENTFRLFTCSAEPLIFHIFRQLLSKDDATRQEYQEFANLSYENRQGPPKLKVTCENHPCGSVAMLNMNFLSHIADDLHHDLLLLPGTDNAFVIMPYIPGMDKESIHQMAQDALQSGHEPILTRNVFLFNRKTKRLGMFI